MNRLVLVCIMIISSLFIASSLMIITEKVESADMINHEIKKKFMDEYGKFLDKNNLTALDGQRLLGELVMKDKFHAKAGIGVINPNLHLILDDQKNAILTGQDKWLGDDMSKRQIVLIANDKIVFEKTIDNKSGIDDLKLILFENQAVHIVDFGTLRGGYYER